MVGESSDYCQLPVSLRKKRSIVNICNKDHYSLLYCISAALRRTTPYCNRTRTSHYNISKIKCMDVTFPTDVNWIPKVENGNNLKIDVYIFDDQANMLKTVYKSEKSTYKKKIDLLLMYNHFGYPHYAYITNIKLLVKNRYCYDFICKTCFQFFRTNALYEDHLLDSCTEVITIPEELKRRTGLVTIQCEDTQDQFQYSITAALFPIYNNQNRFCTKSSLYTKLNESMNYPDTGEKSLTDRVDSIATACQINVNVFLYCDKEIVPYIIPKTHHNKFVDLLLIQKGDLQVFMIIKDLSSIYWKRTGGKHYICRRCLQVEVCAKKFADHEDLCKNFKAQKVKLPDKKELRFRNIRKQFPELFTVFAGKCLPYQL